MFSMGYTDIKVNQIRKYCILLEAKEIIIVKYVNITQRRRDSNTDYWVY